MALWDERIAAFDAAICEHLWDAEEAIFYDVDTFTGERTKVKTFFNLLPLWAGVRLPEEDARRAIERAERTLAPNTEDVSVFLT